MRARTAAACLCLGAALSVGCSAATRHRILGIYFDGVPPAAADKGKPAQEAGSTGPPPPARRTVSEEHGPYAAKLCGACHEPGTANGLVSPKDELCYRCHQLKLEKKYVHGPVASGDCLVCHDPHSSRYPHLLQSETDETCFHCHDRGRVAAVAAHVGVKEECTDCHDAHMSDQKYLLK